MADFSLIIIILIFLIGLIIAYFVGRKIGVGERDRFWESELPGHRKDAVMKSRAVLAGQFSEQLAPYLPDFEHSPSECKFLGKPVDFLVFRGLDNKKVDEIVFVEVKSGKSNLSSVEKSVKDAVEKKKVRWEEYRVPDDLTKKGKDEMEEWNNEK
jgi:predicted Holliday junction resolvase-like endonuclease